MLPALVKMQPKKQSFSGIEVIKGELTTICRNNFYINTHILSYWVFNLFPLLFRKIHSKKFGGNCG
jgi:hypothetical protein